MSNYGATELFISDFFGIQEELQQLFRAHGSVQDLWITSKKGIKSHQGGQGLFGVVRMATHEEAFTAKKALHNTAINGRIVSVRWAANARVLWVGQLGPSVTNAALEAAFAQFGHVVKAVVVSDTQTNSSRRFGFVAFEKKEDCQRAVGMCSKNMFLIGNSARPVLVEMARTEDADEGFTEEADKNPMEGKAPPLGLPAHFALEGTAEFSIALQLRQAQKQYREARTRLQQDLRDTESALLRGIMPNTLLALQPAMQPSLHAPSMAGAGSQAPAPWLTAVPAEVPDQEEGSLRWRRSERSPPRRREENFHHVAPPKRLRTAGNFSDNRYLPRHAADSVPPPDLAAAAATLAPAPRSSGGFVRGGTLGTVAQGGATQPQSPVQPLQRHQPEPPPPDHMSVSTPMGDGTAADQPPPPPLPGAKPLGSHDHGGIGFSGASPASQAPASNTYQPGEGIPAPQSAQPSTSSYMSGTYQPPPPQQLPQGSHPVPPPRGPAPPQHLPPPAAANWQQGRAPYPQQQHWGGGMPVGSQGYNGATPAKYQQQPTAAPQPPAQQYPYCAPQYLHMGGRGGGRNGRGSGY